MGGLGDALACPRCFERGEDLVGLVPVRVARRVPEVPHVLTRRYRCPRCRRKWSSVERVDLTQLGKAIGAKVAPVAGRKKSPEDQEQEQAEDEGPEDSGQGSEHEEAE